LKVLKYSIKYSTAHNYAVCGSVTEKVSESVDEQLAKTNKCASMPVYQYTRYVHTLKKLLLFLNASLLGVTVYLTDKRISCNFTVHMHRTNFNRE
jgi:hypothetical protein